MKKEPTKGSNKKRIIKRRHYHLIIWSAIAALFVATTSTYAWYTIKKREADSAPADVMKPYYLTLLNPSETEVLQLAVGNLFPGEVKQVVFCVSNKDNEKTGLEMGLTTFNYAIELIHTENLALEYSVYELNSTNAPGEGVITALDTYLTDGGNEESRTTYWVKVGNNALSGELVSDARHKEVGFTDASGNLLSKENLPVNAGKYTAYNKDSEGKLLKLEAGTDAQGNPQFDSQYFVLEIDWEEGAEAKFENYEKETDMIYLLVEAIQPKPEKKTN